MRARQIWSTDVRNPYFTGLCDAELQMRVLALEDYMEAYLELMATGLHPDEWLEDLDKSHDYDPTESWSVVADIEVELKARAEETE